MKPGATVEVTRGIWKGSQVVVRDVGERFVRVLLPNGADALMLPGILRTTEAPSEGGSS